MFGVEGLELGHVIQILYIVIGLFVSYWHIERNNMKGSIRTARLGFRNVGNLAWYMLAIIWPILLFARMVEPKAKNNEDVNDQPDK